VVRRVLALVLLGVVVVVCAALAASESLRNDSRKTAFGVTIQFSDSVRITSWDTATFPTCSPSSGRAASFTFSGGELASGGQFRVSWTPSTAESASVEWEPETLDAAQGPVEGLERRRGVNAYLELMGPGDLQILAEVWNANLLRLCIGTQGQRGTFATLFSADPSAPVCLPEDLARLDAVLDVCAKLDIAVIIDLHQTAGYLYMDGASDMRLWSSPALQDRLVGFWQAIAFHCAARGNEVYGYDLLNEPHDDDGSWLPLARRIVAAIRQYDSRHAIVLEATEWGNPGGYSALEPISDPNTVYSFHFYYPYEVAHQGVGTNPRGRVYPSSSWSPAYLRAQMQEAIDFGNRWGVHVLAGEFGVSYYADPQTRAAYLGDCMRLFEDSGLDYCYWCCREWPLWSLEHVLYAASWGELGTYVGSTPALATVLECFARNVRHPSDSVPALPVCVFDEAHWTPGQDINVNNAELAWRLTGFCSVVRHTEGAITPSDLTGASLLVIGGLSRSLADSEVSVVRDYLAGGGALLFYGDCGATGADGVLASYGITFNSQPILSGSYDWDKGSFWVPFEPTAGAARNGGWFHTNWAGSLAVASTAIPVLVTSDRTWRDDGDLNQEPGEPSGPFVLAAVDESGETRVAAVSDNPFSLCHTWDLFSQLVRWLLRLY